MMRRNNLKYLLPIWLFPIFTLWLGCNDEPTSIGLGLLPSQDLVRIDTTTITSTSGTTIRQNVNTGLSDNLLVGKSLGYEARALLQFSGIPDSLKSAKILSASLILRPGYRFGESGGNLSFSIYKMVQGWTELGITWDSLTTSSYEPAVRGAFSGTVADSDSVVISLDPSLIAEWLQASGTEAIQGIILVPTDASNNIIGFRSFQSLEIDKTPQLVVAYSNGGVESTLSLISGQDAFVANIDNLASDPNLIYVQAGVAYRSIVQFDLHSVPEHTGIHQGLLELRLNRSSSQTNPPSVDSLFALFQVSSDSTDLTVSVIGRRIEPDSDVYAFTITPYVQRWVNGRANFGVQLEAWAERSTLDLFTFYSPIADSSLRPKVKITYSRLL